METSTFSQLPISPEILSAINDMGFATPSPIQAQAIPPVIEGRDVVGQAQTGTGKTVAFGIPMVEKVSADISATQALVLCPTRELAIQISEEVKRLLTYKKGINVVPIYGGQPIERQFALLRRHAHIVIGTPGRVMDHLDRKSLTLNNVSMVVLDEADEMLDRGFREDIEKILNFVPQERQTVFFSATMSKPIMDLTKRYQKNPHIIRVERTTETAPKIEQVYVPVREQTKFDALCRFLDVYNHRLSVIFCKTKRRVSELVEKLHMANYHADALHGDMKQSSRDAVMGKFRVGKINILVATDVAARGIDVENVEAVFNYDFPSNAEYYTHRIGRTGRAGKNGISVTFVVGRELSALQYLQRSLRVEIAPAEIPSDVIIEKIRVESIAEKLLAMKADHLQKAMPAFNALCEQNNLSAVDAGALLLAHVMGITQATIEEEPAKAKRPARSSTRELPKNSDTFALVQLSLGKSDRIRTNDVVGAVAGETGIASNLLGIILVADSKSFIEVPREHADFIVQVMNDVLMKGKKVTAKVVVDDVVAQAENSLDEERSNDRRGGRGRSGGDRRGGFGGGRDDRRRSDDRRGGFRDRR
jgi:ATP-dependent RNA helicase DeaD